MTRKTTFRTIGVLFACLAIILITAGCVTGAPQKGTVAVQPGSDEKPVTPTSAVQQKTVPAVRTPAGTPATIITPRLTAATPLPAAGRTDVTGTWYLTDRSLGNYVLNQSGSTISGYFHSGQNNVDYPLEGTVSGNAVTFTKHMAYYDGILTGTVEGNTMTGNGHSVKINMSSPNTPPTDYTFLLIRQ